MASVAASAARSCHNRSADAATLVVVRRRRSEDPTVPVRSVLLLVLVVLPGLCAEPGPQPREIRFDPNGEPLPAGAVARLGLTPPLGGVPWTLAWIADRQQVGV